MKSFNEWLNETNPELTTNANLGMVTTEDESLVLNQLDQLVNRVNGILNNVSESRRAEFIDLFITNLKRS
jgi:hypothetical protein